MARALRLLLICLIMLTLPLQGVSAAVMAVTQSQDAGSAQMADCHGGHMNADTHAPVDPAKAAPHAPAKAKVCGSCCSGAMFGAITLPVMAHAPAGNHYLSAPCHGSAGHIPEGLERPPRRIS